MKVQPVQVLQLNLRTVKKYLHSSTQLQLEHATFGLQDENSYVLGNLQRITNKEDMFANTVNRLTLEEVIPGQAKKKFTVVLSQASLSKLKIIQPNIPLHQTWLALQGFHIDVSSEKSSLSHTVELRELQSCVTVYMFAEFPLFRSKVYQTLSDVQEYVSVQLFAVASGDMKPLTLTRNQASRHTLMGVIDPSLMTSDSPNVTFEQFDLPCHIFLNSPSEYIPFNDIKRGDILRLTNLKGNTQPVTNKLFGVIHQATSMTVFRKVEGKLQFQSGDPAYIYTRQDQSKVMELLEWWKQFNNASDDSCISNINVAKIFHTGYFHILCKVVKIRRKEDPPAIILTITDGTRTQILTKQLENDAPGWHIRPVGSLEVSVEVLGDLVETVGNLQTGMYVELTHVLCRNVPEVSTVGVVSMLQMNHKYSRIIDVGHYFNDILGIQQRLFILENGDCSHFKPSTLPSSRLLLEESQTSQNSQNGTPYRQASEKQLPGPTEITDVPIETTVYDFLADASIKTVTTKLKICRFYAQSVNPCQTCHNGKICIHDFVFGRCTECHQSVASHKLREIFSIEDLLTKACLPCSNKCGCGGLVPQFCATFFFRGLSEDFVVEAELSRQAANNFWGATPSFSFTVGTPAPSIIAKYRRAKTKDLLWKVVLCRNSLGSSPKFIVQSIE